MAIYTISDLHLSFSSDKPMNIFGGAWQNHEKNIKENWFSTVKEDDFVVLPGDHSWALRTEDAAEDLLFIHRMPGKKILLKGNHDLWWATSRKMEELKKANALDSIFFMYNDSLVLPSGGKKHVIAGTRGWLCPGDNEYKPSEDNKIYIREAGRLESSLKKASVLLENISVSDRGNLYVFMHYPPFNQQKDTLFTQHIESSGATHCYYGHIQGFTSFDIKEARRTNVNLKENSTKYSLVSCDYTGNRLIKVTD